MRLTSVARAKGELSLVLPFVRAALMLSAVMVGVAQSAEPPANTPPARSPASKAEYRIGAGDTLGVYVFEDKVTQTCLVRPDGRITIPLAGDLVAEGRTPTELGAEISNALAKYQQASVTVSVTTINSYRVFMLGQVNEQGMLESQVPMRLLQAVSRARGLNPFASKKIVVMRDGARGREQIVIDYEKLLNGKAPESDIWLMSGDVVVVQ
ncbi:MAG: polysaccharide biosynthesis/export family protein [Acidobacteriota bacterium]